MGGGLPNVPTPFVKKFFAGWEGNCQMSPLLLSKKPPCRMGGELPNVPTPFVKKVPRCIKQEEMKKNFKSVCLKNLLNFDFE